MRIVLAMVSLCFLAVSSGCRALTLEGAAPLSGIDGRRPPPATGESNGTDVQNSTTRVTFSVSCQECEVFATPARSRTDGARIVKGLWTSTIDIDSSVGPQVALTVVPVDNQMIRSARILVNGRVAAEREPTGIEARQDQITLTVSVPGR